LGLLLNIVSCVDLALLLFVLPTDLCDRSGKPYVPFRISKESTFVTEPLQADGYPDYVAALNRQYSEGVTPDNNAAVLLWRAIGPNIGPTEYDKDLPPQYFRLLGMEVPPKDGVYFIDFGDKFLGEPSTDADRLQREQIDHQSRLALTAPWSAASFPSGAKWLKRNEMPLKLIVAASERPQFFCPLNPASERGTVLAGNVLAHFDFARASRALCLRAMLRLKEGKVTEAREDLMASRRLAFLLAHHPDVGFWLSAEQLETSAMNGLLALYHYSPPNATGAREFDRLVQDAYTLPQETASPLPRCEFLDALCHVISGVEKTKSGVDRLAGRALVDPLFTRWDDALRSGNVFYDRITEAENKTDTNSRMAALQAIEVDLKAMNEKTKGLNEKASVFRCLPRSYWSSPRGAWGRAMHDSIQAMLTRNYESINNLRDYAITRGQLYCLAAKIGVYRADHGSYPKRLEDLVPSYLPKLPVDMFHGSQFRYRLHGEGYVLYSVGRDGKDSDNLDWLKGNEADAMRRRRTAILVPPEPAD
jgi:hypothetical protein